jgi:DnaK suppressor protein
MDVLTGDDLAHFRSLLLVEKKAILDKSSQVTQGGIELDKNEMSDEVDLASVISEQSLKLKFLDRDRKLLKSINLALEKIEDGSYGYCEGTGDPIPRKRLEARPWCRHSVPYKEKLERMKKNQAKGSGSLYVEDEDEDED